MEFSLLLPLLKKNNIRLIAVGLEDYGYQEFFDGKFFEGELFVDIKEATYRALGYKKYNLFSITKALMNKDVYRSLRKAIRDGLPHNVFGNAMQNGGILIVSKGGEKILMNYRQEELCKHCENSHILEALGIKTENAQ